MPDRQSGRRATIAAIPSARRLTCTPTTRPPSSRGTTRTQRRLQADSLLSCLVGSRCTTAVERPTQLVAMSRRQDLPKRMKAREDHHQYASLLADQPRHLEFPPNSPHFHLVSTPAPQGRFSSQLSPFLNASGTVSIRTHSSANIVYLPFLDFQLYFMDATVYFMRLNAKWYNANDGGDARVCECEVFRAAR